MGIEEAIERARHPDAAYDPVRLTLAAEVQRLRAELDEAYQGQNTWAADAHQHAAEVDRLRAAVRAAWIYSESTRGRSFGNPNQTWRDMNDALAEVPRHLLDAVPTGESGGE